MQDCISFKFKVTFYTNAIFVQMLLNFYRSELKGNDYIKIQSEAVKRSTKTATINSCPLPLFCFESPIKGVTWNQLKPSDTLSNHQLFYWNHEKPPIFQKKHATCISKNNMKENHCQHRCSFKRSLMFLKFGMQNKSIMFNAIVWGEFVNFNIFDPLGSN